MNDTSATSPTTGSTTGQSGVSLLPDGIGAITTIHLVLMALVAIAAIAIIIVGMRRAAVRRHAERKVETNARDAGVPTIEEAATPAPEPAPVAPPPSPVPAAPVPVPPAPEPAAPPPVGQVSVEHTPLDRVPVDTAPAEPAPLADEPIAATAPFDASPATIAATDPAPIEAPLQPQPVQPTAIDPADTPVTMLKGLGPKLEARLAALGITTVGQLASLSPAEAASLDAQLGPFTGRMARDRWLEQARLLATGDRAGFEAAFGRL